MIKTGHPLPQHVPGRRRPVSRRRRLTYRVGAPLVAIAALIAACSSSGGSHPSPGSSASHDHSGPVTPVTESPAPSLSQSAKKIDLYSHTRVGMFAPGVQSNPALVYVPNLQDGTVSVISQATMKVIYTLKVGVGGEFDEPQHVVPGYNLKTLYVNNNRGNSLTPIDPVTGRIQGRDIPVPDPYNLYFTPNGRSAIVMQEALNTMAFYDPKTWQVQRKVVLGAMCNGVNHADFSPDGSYMIATCEFAGRLVKVNLKTYAYSYLDLPGKYSAPQDIKIDPYGKTWYVADMDANGVDEIDGDTFKVIGQLKTGPEAHGLYPSRNGKYLYVANRGGQLENPSNPPVFYPHTGDAGSVSVINFATRKVMATWVIPGGGTPDMGNVSANGNVLWLSGRRSNVVYAIDTHNGHLLAKIPVGHEPHGLAVWPLPGRYSLGHTGILR